MSSLAIPAAEADVGCGLIGLLIVVILVVIVLRLLGLF